MKGNPQMKNFWRGYFIMMLIMFVVGGVAFFVLSILYTGAF